MEELLRLVSEAVEGNIYWNKIEAALSSYALDMSGCPQDPTFHGEGDVWTHTKMVCEELVKLKSFRVLPNEKAQAVFLAALLHDIGKIPTTKWEDSRWISPNHTLVGSKMARDFLWRDLDLCGTVEKQQFRETVCNLIRYHGIPPHVVDDAQGERKLRAIASNGMLCPTFDVELLCILCEADARGRVCADPADKVRMLEQLQLCRELAIESGCFDAPFPFASDYTRFSYLDGKDIAPEAELYDDTWTEVILMSGLPGTGKDTWIREHYSDLPMISLDEIRKEMKISPTENQGKVLEIARERAKQLLRKRQPFVWNATNVSPMIRGKLISLFHQYHAATRIVYLETPWREQLRRNAGRVERVPERAISHMMREMVLPEVKEAVCVEWHCI